jgi:DNA-binding transcriptional LysR family regulator
VAAVLHHTPSAVSQQIAALERGAGITLVERSTRGVTLTDAGRALLATADAIHAELQLAAQRLRALATDGPQALTVVTFPSAGEPLLAPALAAMTAAAGDPVEITVIEAEPDEALGARPGWPGRSRDRLPLPHPAAAARLVGCRRSWHLCPARR